MPCQACSIAAVFEGMLFTLYCIPTYLLAGFAWNLNICVYVHHWLDVVRLLLHATSTVKSTIGAAQLQDELPSFMHIRCIIDSQDHIGSCKLGSIQHNVWSAVALKMHHTAASHVPEVVRRAMCMPA